MLFYPVTSTGPCSRILWTFLLLAASLNAYNQSWDIPICTELVSAPRGNHVVMTCNISTTFKNVTIELTANGKTTTIFNQMPPGNYSNGSWQLQIQGGQSQLVIPDAQNIHAGLYLWKLQGFQQEYRNITLNVTDLVTVNQESESLEVIDEPSSAENMVVIIILIIILIFIIVAISALAWYRRSHSLKHHRCEIPVLGRSHGSAGKSYLLLP
ncbi:secreted and transmembrane protein 1b-like [Sigmodon hispidus]